MSYFGGDSSLSGTLGNIGSVGGNKVLFGKGGLLAKADTPEMSPEEKQILGNYTKAQTAMMPEYANQLHYKINTDGTWTKMNDDEWMNNTLTSETDKKQYQLYQSELGRTKQALEGTLPLSEGMQTQREQEYTRLQNATGISGTNPNKAKATDTIGAQQLNNFNTRWTNIQDQAQQEALGQSTGLLAGGNAMMGQGINRISGMLSGMSGSMSSILNPLQAYNEAKSNAQAQNAGTRSGMVGAGAGLLAAL